MKMYKRGMYKGKRNQKIVDYFLTQSISRFRIYNVRTRKIKYQNLIVFMCYIKRKNFTLNSIFINYITNSKSTQTILCKHCYDRLVIL